MKTTLETKLFVYFVLTVLYLIHRARHVQSLQMTRSVSTHSLPDTDSKSSQQKISRDALPRAVWSMELKTGTLIIGCEKGSVEVKPINYLSAVKVKIEKIS